MQKYNRLANWWIIVLWLIAYIILYEHNQVTECCSGICRFFKVGKYYSKNL